MTELLSDLDRDLNHIQASLDAALEQEAIETVDHGSVGSSMESDSQWEIVDSPEENVSKEQPFNDFMEDVLRDQEEVIELSPSYPQVLLKLLQLVARADGYRERLGRAVEVRSGLPEGLKQLEESCERVRGYIEGAELEEQEPTITDDQPVGLTCSWGQVDMGPELPNLSSTQQLELTLEDYVMAMGFFWDALEQAAWRPTYV